MTNQKESAGENAQFFKMKPVSSRDCLFKKAESDAGVVVNLKNGIYYTLNRSGLILWEAMNGKRTVHQISGRLAKRYGLRPSRALRDTAAYVRNLKRLDLIKVH